MSVPAWKQAIIERRKKQEDEQKEKQAKEEAYLSSMPPWKRALFQKREKEKQQQQEREKASGAASCERSNSFLQRQQQLAQEREGQQRRRTSSASSTGGGWGRRATPPSSPNDREITPPVSPGYGHSHQFFGGTSLSQQQRERSPPKPAISKRLSVTTLPGVDEFASQKVASVPHTIPSWKSKPGSSAVLSAATHWRSKVVSSVKKSYEDKTQSTEIPAWKKALLQRRKEKETKSEQLSSPKEPEPPVPAPSLPIEKTHSPPEVFDEPDLGVSFRKDLKEEQVDPEPVSLLVMKRKPSPESNTVAQEPSLPLQRKASPVEQRLTEKVKYSPAPADTPKPTQLKKTDPVRRPPAPEKVTQPRKTEPKPLTIGRKPSPIELMGAKSNGIERSNSPTGTRNRGSSVTSTLKSHENKAAPGNETPSNEVVTASSHQQKLIPKRSAPAPPPPSTKTQPQRSAPAPQRAPQQSLAPTSRPPARRKPAPEIVNRNSSEPPSQSTAIQTEGVTHRAPVYKEVDEWANVSVDDPKFLSLPTWKQALIKRRRADVAKRMGQTTSIDDVPLSNGPVPSNEKMPRNPQSTPSEDRTASIPSWKKQMMQRQTEGNTSGPNAMSSYEKNHLASKQSSSSSGSSNQGGVKALLGRFSDRRTPPPSPTSSTPTVAISQPRSPSPSSGSIPTQVPTSSSRPAYTSSGVPPTSSSSPHTRKSFTWTPGDDTMPDEALSDDSSEDGGEYTVTAIDDVSSDEDDSDSGMNARRGEDDAAPAVLLLRPPQAISSEGRQQTNLNKKENSILVTSSRPKKRPLRRVAFSDSELITEHHYPKYDYSDYEDIQEGNVSAGFSFSFWKSKVEVEEDEQSGLSHRVHPSLRSPEPDPDTYRYSPSRDSVSPVSSPPPASSSSLHNYKPSILSSYGDSLQQSYTTAMENGTEYEEKEEEEVDSGGGGLVPTEGPSLSNFYASLSSDTAAMLW